MAETFRAADAVRAVDLVEYAQRAHGYELRPRDSASGIAVLEHPGLGDRVAIGRATNGQWVFAGVGDYEPRGPTESVEGAGKRLRESIERSHERGTAVEFAERVTGLGRALEAQLAARVGGQEALNRRMPSVTVAMAAPSIPATTPEQIAGRKREFEAVNRAIDRAQEPPARAPAKAGVFAAFDLVEYAQRQGYTRSMGDGAPGIVVLENRALGDRVALARAGEGRWIYADVRAYAPRTPHEGAEVAAQRLRACIATSPSKGEAADFVNRAETLRRGLGAGLAAGAERGQTVIMNVPDAAPSRAAPVMDARRELLGKRHYDLKPVALDAGGRGRGLDRGR